MKLKFSNFHYFLAGVAVTLVVFMIFKKTSEGFQTADPCFGKLVKHVTNKIPKTNPNNDIIDLFTRLAKDRTAANALRRYGVSDISRMQRSDMTVEALQQFINGLNEQQVVEMCSSVAIGKYMNVFLRKFMFSYLTDREKIDLFLLTRTRLDKNNTATAGTDFLNKYSVPIGFPKGPKVAEFVAKANSAINTMPDTDLMKLCLYK